MRRVHWIAAASAASLLLLGSERLAFATQPLDAAAQAFIANWADATLHAFDFASDVVVYGVAGTAFVWTLVHAVRTRNHGLLAGLAFLLLAVAANNAILKPAWAMERPPTAWSDSFAYPSGHTSSAALLASALLLQTLTRRRLVIVVGIAATAGTLRILGGAHWVTDILGSFAYATAVLALLLANERIGGPRSVPHPAT